MPIISREASAVWVSSTARTAKELTESDKRHFRIILAPEEGERLRDLTGYTRQVMAQAEAELGTRFSWVAVNHHDTGHAHTHIILRGRRANGQDLILPRDFIRHRLREIARDVATNWLGHRTPGQEREALERETTRHAPTRLDRLIGAQLPESQIIEVGRLEALNRDPHVTSALRARTRELRRLGLAREVRQGVLQFEPGWQDRLKAMELHLDIRKQLMAERQLAQQAEQERLAQRLSRSGLER
jgi:type IV secretory pathway VirD2 relaxase